MPRKNERRKWVRDAVESRKLGFIYGFTSRLDNIPCTPLFVGTHNICTGGMQIGSSCLVDVEAQLCLALYDFLEEKWTGIQARVVWQKQPSCSAKFLFGLEFNLVQDAGQDALLPPSSLLKDIEFLLQTELFDSVPNSSFWSLLNCLIPGTVSAGETLISQGERGDSLFIIQEGVCLVSIKKDGNILPLSRLSSGNVVGEMALLTGEKRYAEVSAETDLKYWELGREQFDQVSAEHPDLQMFLTELVTQRLESSQHTADRIIGKYLIKSRMGLGGWSIVYQGIHQTLQMTVAIKMLKHQMAMDKEFNKKFSQEAKIIARLNHKNIVTIYDIEELYKTQFIIMEYLEGESLAERLKRCGRLPHALTVDLLLQVCSGLAYAHDNKIVHLDIKPANIFIETDGTAKILDFGLACSPDTEEPSLLGTVHYAAPEQLTGKSSDQRTDIYALGLTGYEMVTGQKTFPEDDLPAMLEMRLTQEVPDPSLQAENLPAELRSFIIRACRRDPAQRYQSMHEALTDLRPLHASCSHPDQKQAREKHQMNAMFMFFKDGQQGILNSMLTDLSERAQEIGVTVKVTEFKKM